MSEEILKVLEKLKDKNNYQRDCNDGSCFIELFVNEIYILCKFMEDLQQKVEQQEKEIDRLNNIIDEADTKNLELIQKINKIYDVIENKNITGIEARLLIQDMLDKEE